MSASNIAPPSEPPLSTLPPPFSLGDELRQLRLERRIGVTEAAGRAGISKAPLSQWESGNRSPLGPSLERLLEVLDAPFRVRARLLEATDPVHAQLALLHNPLGAPANTGQILKGMRLRAGVTQSDLARAVGVTQGAVAKWENGEHVPSPEALHSALFALRARAEEVRYLLAAPLATPGSGDIRSLEDRLQSIHREPALALREATIILVQRDVWRTATRVELADHMLVEALAWRSDLYMNFDRRDEAAAVAREAIRQGKRCGNWEMAAHAATILAAALQFQADDTAVAKIVTNLERWRERPLSRFRRGQLALQCSYYWIRLDELDAAERCALEARDCLADYRFKLFTPPYIGVESAIEAMARVQMCRGFPERAIEVLQTIPDFDTRGFFALPDTTFIYLWALNELRQPFPADALPAVEGFLALHDEYPGRKKDWKRIVRLTERTIAETG